MSTFALRRSLTLFIATASFGTLSACNMMPGDTATKGGDAAVAPAAAGGAGATANGAAPAAATANLDPILANPQIGDIYAAQLSAFSRAEFGGQPAGTESYGLLKVVAVADDIVTVITEMGAWPQSQGAINDLAGDFSDISWDQQERIPINRSELAQMVTDGKILRTRRPTNAAGAAPARAPATVTPGSVGAPGPGGAAPANGGGK